MYIDSLVSINIYRDDEEKIINKIPLLYYWNGEEGHKCKKLEGTFEPPPW